MHSHINSTAANQRTPAERKDQSKHKGILPAAVAEQQQSQRDGGARHGVGGGHAVLGVVEDLQLHHGRGGGPRPADDILGALPQVHHPHPDDDQPAAQPGVQVPDTEGEEEDVEELVAQLGAQAEEEGCATMEFMSLSHVGPDSLRYLDALYRTHLAAPSSVFAGWRGVGKAGHNAEQPHALYKNFSSHCSHLHYCWSSPGCTASSYNLP